VWAAEPGASAGGIDDVGPGEEAVGVQPAASTATIARHLHHLDATPRS
jgi:hypothetical protein